MYKAFFPPRREQISFAASTELDRVAAKKKVTVSSGRSRIKAAERRKRLYLYMDDEERAVKFHIHIHVIIRHLVGNWNIIMPLMMDWQG